MLSWNNIFFYRESQIRHRFSIALDYVFGNDKLADRLGLLFVAGESLLLRRIIDFIDTSNTSVTPLCLSYPVRSKLEI